MICNEGEPASKVIQNTQEEKQFSNEGQIEIEKKKSQWPLALTLGHGWSKESQGCGSTKIPAL